MKSIQVTFDVTKGPVEQKVKPFKPLTKKVTKTTVVEGQEKPVEETVDEPLSPEELAPIWDAMESEFDQVRAVLTQLESKDENVLKNESAYREIFKELKEHGDRRFIKLSKFLAFCVKVNRMGLSAVKGIAE